MKFLQEMKWLSSLLMVFLGWGCFSFGMAQEKDLPLYQENALYVKYKDHSDVCASKLRPKNGERNVNSALLGISDRVIEQFYVLPDAVSMSLFDNPVLERTFMIQTDPDKKVDIDQLIEELKKNPDVEYVERVPFDRIFSNGTPKSAPVNDPYYGTIQAGSIKMNLNWHLNLINAEKAWQIQTGNPDVVVAVVDNAIWAEHPDLDIPSGRQYNCASRVPGNSNPPLNTATQNKQCDKESLLSSACTAYEFSHGTHCAGVIGAVNNNGVGIASIGGGVSLMGVAGPSTERPMGIVNSYQGVAWAAEHGAKIISCSWGNDQYVKAYEEIMKACYNRGIIVIAAAGNENINPPHYPAAYSPYVISVGSVDADKKKSSFSNHGYWVDILSPGGEDTTEYKTQIFSTTFCPNQYTRLLGKTDHFKDQYYDEMSGTSMATPVLAGVVALMVSYDNTLKTDQVRYILQNTGQDLQKRDTRLNGYCKVVDAHAALNFLTKKVQFGTPLPKDSISTKTDHDSVWLDWKAPETTETIKAYRIYRNGDSIAEVSTLSFLDTNQQAGTLRYGIQPIYENNAPTTVTEIDVTVKTYYTIKATIRPKAECGTVEGAGLYEAQQTFKLKAIPAEGYLFDYWADEKGLKYYGAETEGPVKKNRIFFAWFKSANANEKQNLVANALRLSPNPTTDEVKVSCKDYELKHIRVTDMKGRVVYQADADGHEQTIRTSAWGKGTYLVGVTTSAGFATRKLVKR